MMTEKMLHLGLIGYPLGHSFSKILQEEAFRITGIKGNYHLWEVPATPAGDLALHSRLEDVRTGQIIGMNVTIPHKERIIPFLDALTPIASAIGAVNTIFWDSKEKKLFGHNTDAPAFWEDLKKLINSNQVRKQALVLGAGGAARAVTYQLLAKHWTVSIAARKITRAKELAHYFMSPDAKPNYFELGNGSQVDLEPLGLIVNTTSAGMAPMVETSSWPDNWRYPSDAVVYDLVYNPAVTQFIKQAKKAGLKTRNGLGMLVEQAALAFECWTAVAAPREEMLKAVTGIYQNLLSE
jgi:shikimate dehydrogenase